MQSVFSCHKDALLGKLSTDISDSFIAPMKDGGGFPECSRETLRRGSGTVGIPRDSSARKSWFSPSLDLDCTRFIEI